MAQEAWRAYLELAYGMTEATTKKATKTVRRLVGKSAMTAEQLQSMAEDLLKTSAANREALTKLVRYELDRALGRVGLATSDEVAALTARVRELEGQVRAGSGAAVTAGQAAPVGAEVVAGVAPAKTVAKKTVAKRVAGVPAPDSSPAAKKAPSRKSAPAKKAAAKAAVERIAEASDVPPVKKAARKRAAS